MRRVCLRVFILMIPLFQVGAVNAQGEAVDLLQRRTSIKMGP